MHVHSSTRQSANLLLACLIFFFASVDAAAQAGKAATRSAEFDAFGGFTYLKNGREAPYGNYGVTLGGDYTQFLPRYHGLIIPSFQVRGTLANGSAVNERTINAGVRLATTFRSFHPYGDLLFGNGSITFNHVSAPPGTVAYTHDSSPVYTYGAGVTMDTSYHHLSLMLDFQHQYWDLGGHPPLRFYPQAFTGGVVYHIPWKDYKSY